VILDGTNWVVDKLFGDLKDSYHALLVKRGSNGG
jgi:hypothetical protein